MRKTYRCLVSAPPPANLFPPGGTLLDESEVDAAGASAVTSSQATSSSSRSSSGCGAAGRLVHWVLEDQRAAGEMAHTVVVDEGTAGAQRCELKLKQVGCLGA